MYAKIYFEKQLKMVILVLLIFMEDTKVVFNYSFGARLIWKHQKKILIYFYQNLKSLIIMKCLHLVTVLLLTILISTFSQKVWIMSGCSCFCFAYIPLILGKYGSFLKTQGNFFHTRIYFFWFLFRNPLDSIAH